MKPSTTDPSLELQDKWYNGLIQGLGVSPASFQIIQPSPPLISLSNPQTDNAALWSYLNYIPPLSLTLNTTLSGGNRFLDDYRGVMSQLIPPNNINVQKDIGPDAWKAWTAYLQSMQPPPAYTSLSTLFLQWASIWYPNVANICAADYAAIALNPISGAQNVLLAAYPQGATADFSQTYAQLVTQLNAAPSRTFRFNSSEASGNVSNTWSGGANSNFFGLFGSSSSESSSLFQVFASSQVIVEASFQHILTFTAGPGNWYNSSALNIAYTEPGTPPWREGAQPNWQSTFGPHGNMLRFMTSLVIASGMTIKVHSAAQYSSLQQNTIKSSGSSGFWPFYSGSSGSSSTSTATFNSDATMDILITSLPGIPVIIGGTVLSVADYLGHEEQGRALYAKHAKK